MNLTLLQLGAEAGGSSALLQTVPFVLIIVVFYFMMIRPQRKREKAIQEMRSKLEVGDEVVTVGGIIGLIVSAKADSVIIETGSDRNKLRIARWAIQSNLTAVENAEAEKKNKLLKKKDKDE